MRTEDLNKEVDRLEVGEFVVVRIDADAEEEAGVSSAGSMRSVRCVRARVASARQLD